MRSRFEELIDELGQQLGLTLKVDEIGTCKLRFNDTLSVQLESKQENVLLGCFITDIPPGKFRELTLRDALKANDLFPRTGTFGYSAKNNKLALYDYLPMAEMTGEKLGGHLGVFVETAQQWQTAIEGGAPSPITTAPRKGDGGMFGLKT